MKSELIVALEKENILLNNEQIDKFLLFASLLKEWNEKINLTAILKDNDIIHKHFIDSLLCTKIDLNWQGKKVIDVGTGAGFPGIPLKILFGDAISLTLF